MKLHINQEADAFYLYLRPDDSTIVLSDEVAPCNIFFYIEANHALLFELRHLSDRSPT